LPREQVGNANVVGCLGWGVSVAMTYGISTGSGMAAERPLAYAEYVVAVCSHSGATCGSWP